MILYDIIMFISSSIDRISDSYFSDYICGNLYWNESVVDQVPNQFDCSVYFTVDFEQMIIYIVRLLLYLYLLTLVLIDGYLDQRYHGLCQKLSSALQFCLFYNVLSDFFNS